MFIVRKPSTSHSIPDFWATTGLLRWYAAGVATYPGQRIRTAIALPYNPYHPKPYQRWTLKGMLDLENEVYIAEEFWNFLAGFDVHDQLLDCFERAGLELREEIDAYFGRFRASNH